MTPNMTLKKKLSLLFMALTAGLLLSSFFFFQGAVKDRILEENLEQMKRYAHVLERAWKEGGVEALKARVDDLGVWQGRVTFLDGTGEVLYDSRGTKEDNHLQRPEIVEARTSGVGSSLRYSSTLKMQMRYYALRLSEPGQEAFLRLAWPMKALTLIQRSLDWRFLCHLTVVGLLALLFWHWASRRIFRPLNQIVQASLGVSEAGELRFPLFQEAEFQSLSMALNDMASRLRKADGELRRRHEDLAAMVEALPVGVVMTGEERELLCFNSTALELFGGRDVRRGDKVERLLPSGELYAMFEGPDGSGNFFLPHKGGRILNVALKRLGDGKLLVVRDVSEERAIEEMRRAFTIEAGHELQTPLTAIRAAAELLLDELTERGEDGSLARTILQQQGRMTDRIDDLLLLVKLEKTEGAGERTPEDWTELLEALVDEFRENPFARSVAFETDFPPAARLLCNRSELLRALSNILDNAVRKCVEKYGANPGGLVRLSLEKDEEKGEWRVLIEDNGPGFEAGHAQKVRADMRARSFSYYGEGGTKGKWGSEGHGLGLAIAVRVARAGGGDMELLETSSLGGAAFLITWPIVSRET